MAEPARPGKSDGDPSARASFSAALPTHDAPQQSTAQRSAACCEQCIVHAMCHAVQVWTCRQANLAMYSLMVYTLPLQQPIA